MEKSEPPNALPATAKLLTQLKSTCSN